MDIGSENFDQFSCFHCIAMESCVLIVNAFEMVLKTIQKFSGAVFDTASILSGAFDGAKLQEPRFVAKDDIVSAESSRAI